MAAIVPIRPKYKRYSLSKEQQDCLTYYVIMGCTKQDAFLLFFPEFLKYDDSGRVLKGKLTKAGEQYCKQFFATAEVNDYIRDYKKTLLEKDEESENDIDDNRKDRALKSLLNQAISLVESGTDLDADTVRTIADVFKRLGVLKDEVEQEIRPVRVLPSRCGECRYRIGVESMVLNGEMLDMCKFCKCRKTAEEHGYRFNDGKDLLEIPKEVIEDLESKNNVRMEDILSGKVDN